MPKEKFQDYKKRINKQQDLNKTFGQGRASSAENAKQKRKDTVKKRNTPEYKQKKYNDIFGLKGEQVKINTTKAEERLNAFSKSEKERKKVNRSTAKQKRNNKSALGIKGSSKHYGSALKIKKFGKSRKGKLLAIGVGAVGLGGSAAYTKNKNKKSFFK